MASPQPNKFVRISSELLEAIARFPFTGIQIRLILWVIRKTYGWNKKTARFTWYGMARDLKANRSTLFRSGLGLAKAMVLAIKDGEVGLQKDYEQWDKRAATEWEQRAKAVAPVQRPDTVTLVQRKALHPGNATVTLVQRSSCTGATDSRRAKDIYKDITKDIKDITPIVPKGDGAVFNDGFKLFWMEYPRKVAKKTALKYWLRIKPDAQLLEKILEAIKRHKRSEQWIKDGGKFIPHPTTWLNQERWEDEIVPQSGGKYAGIKYN